MSDLNTAAPVDDAPAIDGGLSPEAKTYLESRGEVTPDAKVETPAPKPAVEPQQAAADEDDDDAPLPGNLPPEATAALRATRAKERARREALNTKIAVMEEQNRNLAALVRRALGEDAPVADAEPKATPKPEEDIIGYLKSLEEKVNGVDSTFKKRQEAEERARQVADLMSPYYEEVENGGEEASDAITYMGTIRLHELAAMGYTKEQALATIEQDEMRIVYTARSSGKSPLAVIKELAKSRGWNFKPEPAIEQEQALIVEAPKAKPAPSLSSIPSAGGGPADTPDAADAYALYEKAKNGSTRYRQMLGA